MTTAKPVVGELNVYFCPKPSKIYERYIFRLTKQEPGEKLENFLDRLRNQCAKCQFKDAEEQLIDQIVEKCSSVELRQTILAIGDMINLTGIVAASYALEIVNLEDFVDQKPNTLNINHIKFSKDVENQIDTLAIDPTTLKIIPCDEETSSSELPVELVISKPTYDLKVEFDEGSISESTRAGPGQSIEPTKTEIPSQVFSSIKYDDTDAQAIQPQEHAEEDEEEKQFKCNICRYATTQRKYLAAHKRRRHTAQKASDCRPSDFATVTSGESKNLKRKQRIKKIMCALCGYICLTPFNLRLHMRKHTGEKPFKCTICDYAGAGRYKLTMHMRTHTGVKPYKCSVCDYATAHCGNLALHMRKHTGEKPFKCEVCDHTCSQRNSLKIHMRLHTGEEPFRCSVCEYTTKQKSTLTKHMRRHTGAKINGNSNIQKPIKCLVCDRSFTQRGGLQVHMRQHTGEKPFKCEICDFACKQQSALKSHMRGHTGEKPFKCSVCDYATAHSGNLLQHMRTHTGEKPYKCSYCSYACKQSVSLAVHVRRHTGEKPFKCEICEFACIEKAGLRAHMRKHTGQKPFQCRECDFSCKYRSGLTSHMRSHTGEDAT